MLMECLRGSRAWPAAAPGSSVSPRGGRRSRASRRSRYGQPGWCRALVRRTLVPVPPISPNEEEAMPPEGTANADRTRDALAGTLKRTELQHEPSSIPGREIVQVLTEIPE